MFKKDFKIDTDKSRKVLNIIFDISFHHSLFLVQNLKSGTPARLRLQSSQS